MHFFQKVDGLGRLVIGAAVEVSPLKGPGLIESISQDSVVRLSRAGKLFICPWGVER